MAPKPTYTLSEKTDGPEAWRGWYYRPAEATRGTGPFSTRAIAKAAADLWVVATERAQKNRP